MFLYWFIVINHEFNCLGENQVYECFKTKKSIEFFKNMNSYMFRGQSDLNKAFFYNKFIVADLLASY